MFYVLVWCETTDGRLKQLYTLMGIERARRIAAEVSRTAQLEISFCDRKCHRHRHHHPKKANNDFDTMNAGSGRRRQPGADVDGGGGELHKKII